MMDKKQNRKHERGNSLKNPEASNVDNIKTDIDLIGSIAELSVPSVLTQKEDSSHGKANCERSELMQ